MSCANEKLYGKKCSVVVQLEQRVEKLRYELMIAIDYLQEGLSDTKQYDFEVRAKGFIQSKQSALIKEGK